MINAAEARAEDDPLRAKIDQLLEEHHGQPEEALRALLIELEAMQNYFAQNISHGHVRGRLFQGAKEEAKP